MTDTQIISTIDKAVERAIGTYSTLIDQKFKNVDLQFSHQLDILGDIEEKVSKQNSSVAKAISDIGMLDSRCKSRALDCPLIEKVNHQGIRLDEAISKQKLEAERTITVADFKKKIRNSIVLGCTIIAVLWPIVSFLLGKLPK